MESHPFAAAPEAALGRIKASLVSREPLAGTTRERHTVHVDAQGQPEEGPQEGEESDGEEKQPGLHGRPPCARGLENPEVKAQPDAPKGTNRAVC